MSAENRLKILLEAYPKTPLDVSAFLSIIQNMTSERGVEALRRNYWDDDTSLLHQAVEQEDKHVLHAVFSTLTE